jgi:superfamily II DNA/RNA helicase
MFYSVVALLAYNHAAAFAPVFSFRPRSLQTQHGVKSANDGTERTSFQDLGLTNDIVGVTERMGWDIPTPVQQLSIPSILEMTGAGRNNDNNSLWCEAPTGSGKTGGFALPLLQILLHEKRPDKIQLDQGYVSTLILCPTRELAAQTGSVIQRLISYLPKRYRSSVSVEVVHGGVQIEPQVAALAMRRQMGKTVDFLVATPGRLVDILKHDRDDPVMAALEKRVMDAFEEKGRKGAERRKSKRGRSGVASSLTLNDIQEMELDRMDDDGRGSLDEMLRRLDFLIFDEADRLLGGAFLKEMEDLMSLLPSRGQNDMKVCLFSATFPEEVEKRVGTILSKLSPGTPLRVATSASMMQRVQLDDDLTKLSNRKEKRLQRTTQVSTVAKDSAPNIQHRAIRLNQGDRTQALRYLIEQNSKEWDRVLVFVGTRYASEHVTRKLRRYGIKAAELHGKLDQEARERRLKSFRSGNTQVLISTDVSARGIDVEGLPVVVNYDLPRGAADFTHRTGRTGRAGKDGLAVSFITASKASHFDFIEKKELGGKVIEREVLPDFMPDEDAWLIESAAGETSIPGVTHSQQGLAHDRMFGGVKGRRKSKKDKLREAAATLHRNVI